MIRLTKVDVKNFKNISSASFDLQDFNLLVGPNNSGKTNFFKVFPFLNSVLFSSNEMVSKILNHNGRPFNTPSVVPNKKVGKGLVVEFAIEFDVETNNEQTYKYKYSLSLAVDQKDNIVSMRFSEEKFQFRLVGQTGPWIKIFERNDTNLDSGREYKSFFVAKSVADYMSALVFVPLFSSSNLVNVHPEISVGYDALKSILSSPIYYFSNIALRSKKATEFINDSRTYSSNLEEDISILSKDELKWRLFTEVLSKVLNIEEVHLYPVPAEVGKETVIQNFVVVKRFKFSGHIMGLSDGSLNIIALVTNLLIGSSSILFIEEIENSIHPKALEILVRFLQSFKDQKQIIISTHSPSMLHLVNVDQVIVSNVQPTGFSVLSKVENSKELEKSLNKGVISFGELFLHNFKIEEEDESVL